MVMSPAAMLASKHKTPLKSRTLSPSQNILSPNNDDYERAQVRAARAAAQRRKSFVGLEAEKSRQKAFVEEDLLGKDQILDLLQNCIKLSTENVSTLFLLLLDESRSQISFCIACFSISFQ